MTREGDAQKLCKDRADADYDAAKANARAHGRPSALNAAAGE